MLYSGVGHQSLDSALLPRVRHQSLDSAQTPRVGHQSSWGSFATLLGFFAGSSPLSVSPFGSYDNFFISQYLYTISGELVHQLIISQTVCVMILYKFRSYYMNVFKNEHATRGIHF